MFLKYNFCLPKNLLPLALGLLHDLLLYLIIFGNSHSGDASMDCTSKCILKRKRIITAFLGCSSEI